MTKLSKDVLRRPAAYWGRQGGKTAARNMTPEQRRARARKAGRAGGRGREKTNLARARARAYNLRATATEAVHD